MMLTIHTLFSLLEAVEAYVRFLLDKQKHRKSGRSVAELMNQCKPSKEIIRLINLQVSDEEIESRKLI